MSLIQMADWLTRVENMAFEFYQKAQGIPGLSTGMVRFLRECAEEEAWHLNAMKKAGRLLEAKGDTDSDLDLDPQTTESVEAPLRRVLDSVGGNPLSEQAVMGCIADSELSEWNYIFIYFLGKLRQYSGELLYPAARIQSHIHKVIDYLELSGYEHDKLNRLKALPRVWEESILVVDDDAGIRELISGILKAQGRVDMARDGQEALGLLKNHYYKAIVTDLVMPNLDGTGFFREARKIHPNIGERFIFLTGNVHMLDQGEPGIEEVAVLAKPFRAWELIERVKALLARK